MSKESLILDDVDNALPVSRSSPERPVALDFANMTRDTLSLSLAAPSPVAATCATPSGHFNAWMLVTAKEPSVLSALHLTLLPTCTVSSIAASFAWNTRQAPSVPIRRILRNVDHQWFHCEAAGSNPGNIH